MHQFRKIKRAIDLLNKRWIFPLPKIAEKFKTLILAELEEIEVFVKAHLVPLIPVSIFNKQEAIKKAKNLDL